MPAAGRRRAQMRPMAVVEPQQRQPVATRCWPQFRRDPMAARRRRRGLAANWSQPGAWKPVAPPTRRSRRRWDPPGAAGELPPPLAAVRRPFEEAPLPRCSGIPSVRLPAIAANRGSRRASAGRRGRRVYRDRSPRCGVPAESAVGQTGPGRAMPRGRRRGLAAQQPAGIPRQQRRALRPRRRPRARTRQTPAVAVRLTDGIAGLLRLSASGECRLVGERGRYAWLPCVVLVLEDDSIEATERLKPNRAGKKSYRSYRHCAVKRVGQHLRGRPDATAAGLDSSARDCGPGGSGRRLAAPRHRELGGASAAAQQAGCQVSNTLAWSGRGRHGARSAGAVRPLCSNGPPTAEAASAVTRFRQGGGP